LARAGSAGKGTALPFDPLGLVFVLFFRRLSVRRLRRSEILRAATTLPKERIHGESCRRSNCYDGVNLR
jgi:hypothetical protein